MATAHAHPGFHAFITHDAPPSPTLTNPDLILPWQPHTSSPTPLASSPTLHPGSGTPSSLRSTNFDPYSPEMNTEYGVATAVVMPFRMKPPPPTTIIPAYHGYDHGAPLSDIGEEESTPKSRKTRSRSPSPDRSRSPTRMPGYLSKSKNRLSNKSGSSTGSDIGDWENFDSSTMMNARLAADVAKAKDDVGDLEGLDSKRNSSVTVIDDEMATLNLRAERILANAKKRLTHMENNLSNARNSILISAKSSPTLGDLHQPVGGLYRSISQGGDRRLGQSYMRKSKPLYPVIKTVHHRGLSDPPATAESPQYSTSPQIRSASAMEYGRRVDPMISPAGPPPAHSPASSRSFNSSLRVLEEEDSPSTNMTSPPTPAARGLGISNSSPTQEPHKRQVSNSSIELARSSSQTSTRSARELREQMSDLKTRIADLKQKAQSDTLRRQSQQSVRTSSPFTNAPEQWYAAAPEYKEPGTPINTNAGLGWSPSTANGPASGLPRSQASPKDSAFGEGEIVTPATIGHRSEIRTDVNTPTLHQKTLPLASAIDRPIPFTQGSFYEDAPEEFDEEGEDPVAASEEEQVYLNEVLEESLQDGDPDIPIMIDQDYSGDVEAERHEDRVDAFDYENMFLHSALGNYSQSDARSRSNSNSSVETRRAAPRTPIPEEDEDEYEEDSEESPTRESNRVSAIPEEEDPPTPKALLPPSAPWMKAARSNSMDSVTTNATFATAVEGMEDDESDEGSSIPSEILNWGTTASPIQQQQQQLPLSNGSPQRSTTTTAWPTPPTSMTSPRPASRGKQTHLGSILPPPPGPQPRGALPTPPVRSPTLPIQANHHHSSSSPTFPIQSNSAAQQQQTQTHHPANTEILMASLITLADPTFQMPTTPNAFADVDKGLVIGLLRAVGAVCDGILKAEAKGEAYEARVFRRRLDEARRLLAGSGEK